MLDFEEAQLTEQNVRDLVYEEMKKYQVGRLEGRAVNRGWHGRASLCSMAEGSYPWVCLVISCCPASSGAPLPLTPPLRMHSPSVAP